MTLDRAHADHGMIVAGDMAHVLLILELDYLMYILWLGVSLSIHLLLILSDVQLGLLSLLVLFPVVVGNLEDLSQILRRLHARHILLRGGRVRLSQ